MTFHTDPAGPAADPSPIADRTVAEPPPADEPAMEGPAATAEGPAATAGPATAEPGAGTRARALAEPSRRRGGTLIIAGALVAIIAGSTLFLAGWTLGRQAALQPGTPVSELDAWQPFWDTYSAITDRYAGGPVDRSALMQGAIKGMIASLNDPFSFYMTPDEFKASLQGISGQFSGIGTTVGTVDASGTNTSCTPLSSTCRLAIESVIPGSPAEKAGLQAGDIMTAVDGTSVDGLTVDQTTQRIRGAKGTPVTLSIARGTAAPFTVTITRANILQPEVSAKSLADGAVGYIKLAGFSDQASIDFKAAVAADVKAGQKAILVDLRGNPGGFVTAARDIASQFLASGAVFWEQDAAGSQTEVAAEPGGAATDPSIKVAVLVDSGTASASEIVSAALHDHGRAVLVGSKTYGKGTVQQWTQLEGDSGGFRLTIARWLTPDKVWINGTGITPDVAVPAGQATKPGQDPVLDAGLRALGFGAAG
jgi:carboxyl-terminal processing protease